MDRVSIIFLLFILASCAVRIKNLKVLSSDDPVFTFAQRIDHFDPLNFDTYNQRYSVNVSSNWKQGDPIFIFLAGEAPMEFFEFQEVQAKLWAKQFGAMYISIEHRFYGESIPYNSTSSGPYSSQNLIYLSSQQALADAANFISQFQPETLPFLIKQKLISPQAADSNATSPWIVFGCSYSGALSAWFRTKYSNLVIGSVAPSGPVYATANYSGYIAHFQNVAPSDCLAAVQKGIALVSHYLKTDSGRKILMSKFNTCEEIPPSQHEQYYFLYTLAEAVASSDQFQNPPQWPLNQTCQILTSSSDILANWAQVVQLNGGNGDAQCVDYNEQTAYIEPMQNTQDQDRSWMWQTCTEFGWYNPSYGSIFWPTRINLNHQLQWCEQIFGINGLVPNTNWTNAYYGGYDLHGSNIIFSNGMYDPWHLLSINEANEWGVSAVTYEAGHCATMTAAYDDDPPSLVQARKTIGNYLQNLLKNYYANL